MDIDLTQRLRLKMAPRPRVRGRYNSSELWFLINGGTSPQTWMNSPEKSMKELLAMWGGTGMHNQLEDLLGREHSERKAEVVYKDIVLVGKADFFPPGLPDTVFEFKSSDKKMKEAKPWHLHQVKLYCTMFAKAKGMVYQPMQNDDGLYLKHLGTVERDDKWFEGEMEKLYQFHLEVEKLWGAK